MTTTANQPAAAGGLPARGRPAAAPLAGLVGLIGLVATLGLWRVSAADLREDVRTDLAYRVRDAEARVATRMDAYEETLRGAAGLIAASERVTREAFHAYVDSLRLGEHFPGIQAVGFAARIGPGAPPLPGVTLPAPWPAEGRTPASALVFMEPPAGRNARAFGFDMTSEPVRRAAMEAARDGGRAALSGRIRLLQENDADAQAGFILYLPVYRHGAPAGTVAARREAHLGWVSAAFRADDLMRGILGERAGDLGLALYDGEQVDPAALLHASDPAAVSGAGEFRATRHLAVAGRPWTLVAEARPALVERFPTYEPPLVALTGTLASLLVAALVWLLASGRERALRLAGQLDLDRAAAHRARQDTEALLREIVDTTPDLVFVKDAAGRHLLDNPAVARVVGRPVEALLGRSDAEMLGAEAAAPLLEHDELVKRTGVAHAFEEVVATPAGPRTYLSTKIPRRDADGAITGVIGIARDITERKRAEEALRQREAASASVLGAVEHGVVHLLADGTVSAANPAAEQLFGMGQAEMVAASAQRDSWRVLGEDGRRLDPSSMPDVPTRLTGQPQPEVVVGLHRRDGRKIWIAASVRPLGPGPVPLPTPVVVTFRDVTEERRRATEAWERQQRLALMLARADSGFWDRDLPTGRVDASDRTFEIMGYRRGEVEATARFWEDHLHPEERARVLAALEAHLRGESPIYEVEHRMRRRDGSWIWVLSVGKVVEWRGDGAPLRVVGTMSDISARKFAEEALRASEGRLRESTDHLRALAVRLQAVREEETARISRDLHDELGQLLTGLQLDLAELEAAVDAPAPAEPLLDKVVAASELTGTIIAAVQRIAHDLRPAALDRVGLPAGLRQEARRFERRTGVEARVEAAPDFPELSRDAATALYRICQEALTNVARHAAARHVRVTLSAGPDQVVLEVEDDGRGLAPGSEDRPASLGLLGMRERALALGGEVAFEAAPGGGTRVRARLPAAAVTARKEATT